MFEGANKILSSLLGIPGAGKVLLLIWILFLVYSILFVIYSFSSWLINYYRIQDVITYNKKLGVAIQMEIGWKGVVVTPILLIDKS